MAGVYQLDILSPKKETLDISVQEVLLPAYDGETEILPEHSDFIGVLGIGPMRLRSEDGERWCLVSKGVYQVSHGRLSIFAELTEDPDDINKEEAESNLKEAKARYLDFQHYKPEDFDELKDLCELNQARLDVLLRSA